MRPGVLLLLAAGLWAQPVNGQAVRVSVAEDTFRAEPDGTVLAVVHQGARLGAGPVRGQWREATLEGWIWAASVRPDSRAGHDLVVAVSGGENLRAAPNGEVLARLQTGMLLREVERDGAWVRVQRTGWIREPSVQVEAEGAAPGAGAAAPAVADWARLGPGGGPLLAAPAGDTVARIQPGTAVEVLGRDGNWTRIRIDGWIWTPAFGAETGTAAVATGVTAATVMANPETFRGRVLEWTVQFIALERAEKIRTDFYEGEPFILARGPDDESGFVYLAVPPDLLDRAQRLTPLERVMVRARVRTGRSPLMGSPVLDLLEFR